MCLPITPRGCGSGPTFFAIFGPTMVQIYGKKVGKILKNYVLAPFGLKIFERQAADKRLHVRSAVLVLQNLTLARIQNS